MTQAPDGHGQPVHDLVVFGGVLVDGTGAPRRAGDIAVDGGRISAVAPPGILDGRRRMDARGAVVMPGVIDIHSHADLTLVLDGRAESCLLQGVTSVVTGNCGYGVAPVGLHGFAAATAQVPGGRQADLVPRWHGFAEYLDVLRLDGVGVNVFPLVAHGSLCLAAGATAAGARSDGQLAVMGDMLRDCLAAGAVGISTGLEYAPGLTATATELATLNESVAEFGGFHASHVRDRGQRLEQAVQEVLDAAVAGGCRLQLSHFLPRPGSGVSTAHMRALKRCAEAPVPVRLDAFPFSHGPTPLLLLFPAWLREGKPTDVAERIAAAAGRFEGEVDERFWVGLADGSAGCLRLVSDGGTGRWTGATLAEVSRSIGGSQSPEQLLTAALTVLAHAVTDYGDVAILERWAEDEALEYAMGSDDFLLMGDGMTTADDGPLRGRRFSHSDTSWVPRVLTTFVRDKPVTTLERAVRRMTADAADQIGLTDRGRLVAGARADLAVIDLAELAPAPELAPGSPRGVRHVVVNGTTAVADGHCTGVRAGRVGIER